MHAPTSSCDDVRARSRETAGPKCPFGPEKRWGSHRNLRSVGMFFVIWSHDGFAGQEPGCNCLVVDPQGFWDSMGALEFTSHAVTPAVRAPDVTSPVDS